MPSQENSLPLWCGQQPHHVLPSEHQRTPEDSKQSREERLRQWMWVPHQRVDNGRSIVSPFPEHDSFPLQMQPIMTGVRSPMVVWRKHRLLKWLPAPQEQPCLELSFLLFSTSFHQLKMVGKCVFTPANIVRNIHILLYYNNTFLFFCFSLFRLRLPRPSAGGGRNSQAAGYGGSGGDAHQHGYTGSVCHHPLLFQRITPAIFTAPPHAGDVSHHWWSRAGSWRWPSPAHR